MRTLLLVLGLALADRCEETPPVPSDAGTTVEPDAGSLPEPDAGTIDPPPPALDCELGPLTLAQRTETRRVVIAAAGRTIALVRDYYGGAGVDYAELLFLDPRGVLIAPRVEIDVSSRVIAVGERFYVVGRHLRTFDLEGAELGAPRLVDEWISQVFTMSEESGTLYVLARRARTDHVYIVTPDAIRVEDLPGGYTGGIARFEGHRLWLAEHGYTYMANVPARLMEIDATESPLRFVSEHTFDGLTAVYAIDVDGEATRLIAGRPVSPDGLGATQPVIATIIGGVARTWAVGGDPWSEHAPADAITTPDGTYVAAATEEGLDPIVVLRASDAQLVRTLSAPAWSVALAYGETLGVVAAWMDGAVRIQCGVDR